MLKFIKKLCLIMVAFFIGSFPLLNATSFFPEVGINQSGKIVETDKTEAVAYMGDRFSVYIEYENDEFEWITIPIEYMSKVFVDYEVFKDESSIKINQYLYDYIFDNGTTKITGLTNQISDSKTISSDVFYSSSFWTGGFLARIQEDGRIMMVDYNCLLESENDVDLNMSDEYINYVDNDNNMFWFYMDSGYQIKKPSNFYKHDLYDGYHLIAKDDNGFLHLSWDEYINSENGIDLNLSEEYVCYLNDEKTIFYIYMENCYQAKYPNKLFINHSDLLPAGNYIVAYSLSSTLLPVWTYDNFINNNINDDGSFNVIQNYDYEVAINNNFNIQLPIDNYNLVMSRFNENFGLVYDEDINGNRLYYISIDEFW